MTKLQKLQTLQNRLNQDIALYLDHKKGVWYMTNFTLKQFLGNREEMRILIEEIIKESK